MEFTKKELGFLQLYDMGSDTQVVMNDKLLVEAKDGKVLFAQISDDAIFYKEIEKVVDGELKLTIPIKQLVSIIKSAKDDDVITFTENGIKFGTSKYEFEMLQLDYTQVYEVMKTVRESDSVDIVLSNLEKLGVVKNYKGKDDFDAVAVFNNHFVTSNKDDVVSYIETNNSLSSDIFIPGKIVGMLNNIKDLSEINFKLFKDEFYYFNIDGVNLVSVIKDYSLENIFEYEEMFLHPNKVIVDRQAVLSLLKRVNIMASSNLEGRVYLSFEEGKLIIESKETNMGYAKEEFVTTVPSVIYGQSVIVSIKYLVDIFSTIKDNNVEIMVAEALHLKTGNEDDAPITITFKDNSNSSMFVHMLYEMN